MEYACSFCGDKVEGDVVTLKEHTDAHVIDLIKEKHPEWVETNNVCPKCVEYYRSQIKGE